MTNYQHRLPWHYQGGKMLVVGLFSEKLVVGRRTAAARNYQLHMGLVVTLVVCLSHWFFSIQRYLTTNYLLFFKTKKERKKRGGEEGIRARVRLVVTPYLEAHP